MKASISSQNMSTVQFTHQENSKQQEGPPRNSGRHHCTYWEIQTTINGQQTDQGLNLQNRLGFILTYSTNKSMVEGRYALKAYKVSIIHCLFQYGENLCPYVENYHCVYVRLGLSLRVQTGL